MKYKVVAAAFGLTCFIALPVAYAFEIVTNDSGMAAPIFFTGNPDGGDSDASDAWGGSPFVNDLNPFEYRVPEGAFEGYSYSGYSFADDKPAQPAADAKDDAKAPAKPEAEKKQAGAK